MVDVMGHLGMALVWAVPAWFVWHRRVSLAFVGFVLATAMLPDVDLVLRAFLPVSHHGVTHTLVFVTAVAICAGLAAERVLEPTLRRWWRWSEGTIASERGLFAFAAGGLLLGGASHLFADMLSAPDVAAPINPFWPLFAKPWSVDLIWYNSPWWNAGLLTAAVALHLVVAYAATPLGHRYRLRGVN